VPRRAAAPAISSRRGFLVGTAALAAGCAHSDAESALDEIERTLGGRIGFSALDTDTCRRLEWRARERFALCSTFKAALAAVVLTRIDAGDLRRDHVVTFDAANVLPTSRVTAGRRDGRIGVLEACEAVVSASDNTAANALLRLVGGPAALTMFFRGIGDAATRLDRYELELNSNIPGDPRDTTTPRAMLGTLHALLLGDALSESSRELLADWMVAEQNGRARLRAGLPSTWRVANKPGTGANGAVNDIGVAWPPRGAPLVLVVYTDAPGTELADGEAAIARAAALAVRHFELGAA
jgi:beta-lactamase class A